MVDHIAGAANEEDPEGEGASEGIKLENIREMSGFVLHATRRHPKLAIVTFVVVSALGLAVAVTMPRTYSAQVTLLAQRSAIHALTGQNQQLEDNPTKNVAAMILRRDNLVALAKEANLVQRFRETRPAVLRFKDRIMSKLFGEASDKDMLSMLVLTLEKKLEVTVTEDSNVTISVDWTTPQLAYDLVTLVQKNFLEARYDSDVAVINDSIAVLEDHAKSELAHVDAELEDYQKIVSQRAPKAAAPLPREAPPRVLVQVPGAAPRAAPDTNQAAAQPLNTDVATELEEKRIQIRSIEQARRATLDGLNQKLSEAQLTLTPMHPTVIALQQQIAAMNEPPPELAQLRSEERALMAQIAPPRPETVRPAAPRVAPQYRFLTPPGVDAGTAFPTLPEAVDIPADQDGQLQLAQSELALAIHSYEDALNRLDATKVELDITGAAYKHRYTVVTPPEVPKSPKKATAQLVGVGAVAGGIVLALLLATALDILGGLVLESWQVRRQLKLDVLSELDNPS